MHTIETGSGSLRARLSSLHTARRGVIQSSGYTGLSSPLDQYERVVERRALSAKGRGNYYRYQQKLWPSTEALERELTTLQYSSVERTPLALLPKRDPPRQVFACEGRGGTMLLEAVQAEVEGDAAATPAESSSAATAAQTEAAHAAVVDADDEESAMMDALLGAELAINSKILTDRDVDGTVLASARDRAEQILSGDLSVNTLALAPTEAAAGRRVAASARDLAGASWDSLGLDPVLSAVAAQFYGPSPSRLQTRLLPALLNEDHNDVLFNGVTGSGKTSALLLALLQGVRNEAAGMNVLVASNAMQAMRLHDALHALCRRGGNGRLVDRPAEDYSWIYLASYKEDYEKYYKVLRRSLHSAHGPVRVLITTADTLCQLLFEKKMEFEDFGYLRRVYVDDVGVQVPMLSSNAPTSEVRERLRNPLAAELLLGTLHQLPGPHIRSVLQLALVSADLDGRLLDHLKALCVKPTAHTVVVSPVRVPSTVHCLFSFHLFTEDVYAYAVKLIWNARDTIPGRVLLIVPDSDDVLHVRRRLRALGMKACIFSEVYGDGAFREAFKFLVLKETEAFGVDIPLVSHAFALFAPSSWQSFLHLSGRVGRLGNVGWFYIVCDKRDAKHVRRTAEDLSIDFCHHVVQQDLTQADPAAMDRLTKEPELYGLDPQFAVRQHYEVQAENPDMAYRPREFFSRPASRQFQLEDYTPLPILHRRFTNATKLARDLERNPDSAAELQKAGLLNAQHKPTKRLWRTLEQDTRPPRQRPPSRVLSTLRRMEKTKW